MKIISHRGLWSKNTPQNSMAAFAASQSLGCGIETDIRSFQGKLYVAHDPIELKEGLVRFEELLELWSSSAELPLFLNIKEDGLVPLLVPQQKMLSQLRPVFFDMSVPQLVQFAKVFPKSMLATRFSEFEPTPSALKLCDWIWVDGFEKDPKLELLEPYLDEQNLSLAIVSPELHQREPHSFWNQFKKAPFLNHPNVFLCTDRVCEVLEKAQ